MLAKLSHRKAKDCIAGYSYNAFFYIDVINELKRLFGLPQSIVTAYLKRLDDWACRRMDQPDNFCWFNKFFRQLVQTFQHHGLHSDPGPSAVLRLARDNLSPGMLLKRNRNLLKKKFDQPALVNFKD